MEWLKAFGILIGRIFLVLIFLNSGIGKIEDFGGILQYMGKYVPFASWPLWRVELFLIGAIFLELFGSITIILGYFTRYGALLLLIFLVAATIIFHTNFTDQIQMIMFMKNVSMFGGCLLLLSVGPGRLSLDYLLRGKKTKK